MPPAPSLRCGRGGNDKRTFSFVAIPIEVVPYAPRAPRNSIGVTVPVGKVSKEGEP